MTAIEIVNYAAKSAKEAGKMIVKLGCFTHGQIKDEEVKFENVRICEEDIWAKKKKQIVVADTQNMTYIGKNYGEESYENDLEQMYLGALDPETGILEVYDVNLFKFKPYFQEMEEDEPDSTTAKPSDLSYAEQNDQLTKAFGSRRKRKAMEERVKNQVEETTLKKVLDSTVKEGMETAVSTQKKLNDLIVADSAEKFLLPPFDNDTDKTEEIYKLSDIISDADMEVLTDSAQEFFDCNEDTVKVWTEEAKYPGFILDCLKKLPEEPDKRLLRCKSLVYLYYLMKFYKIRASEVIKKKDPLPPEWPETIRKKLLERYADPPALVPSFDKTTRKPYRNYSANHQHRLLCHTMVLALILDNFSLKMASWLKELGVGVKRLCDTVRLIGCKVQNTKNVPLMTAILKAPLNKTQTKKKIIKKRR